MPLIAVYIFAAVIAISIAVFLNNTASLHANKNLTFTKTGSKELTDLPLDTDEALHQTIYREIGPLVESNEQREKIGSTFSRIFNKELKQQVQETTYTLETKYNKIINEKMRNEEIALKKYTHALGEKRDTESVIRSIAEGLVVVDSKGKVIMINPAAEKLLGVNKKEKIGKNLKDGLKEEQLVSLMNDTPGGKHKEIELLSQQDETKKILRASSAVIEDEKGKTVGMVSVLSDITKQKELDNLKSHFVASVSHELRTPLVSIQKSVSLLLSKDAGPISETQKQFLSIADRNLKRLSNLINDLLDLSKFEAGKMKLVCEPTSISTVINDASETFNTWASTKSITIEKKIHDNLPQTNLDSERIIQVLNNLLGNAIKFTPNNGTITVEASIQSNNQKLKVSVADTGLGIAEKDLAQIFNKFYQARNLGTTNIQGTGLGLSLAKEIVELHGGKIWAESTQNKGSTFIFTLPLNTNHIGGG